MYLSRSKYRIKNHNKFDKKSLKKIEMTKLYVFRKSLNILENKNTKFQNATKF